MGLIKVYCAKCKVYLGEIMKGADIACPACSKKKNKLIFTKAT